MHLRSFQRAQLAGSNRQLAQVCSGYEARPISGLRRVVVPAEVQFASLGLTFLDLAYFLRGSRGRAPDKHLGQREMPPLMGGICRRTRYGLCTEYGCNALHYSTVEISERRFIELASSEPEHPWLHFSLILVERRLWAGTRNV